MKPTELKNYNLTTKLIVPLLDDNIVLEDVSEESGFVNAYTDDINKPFYDNHIFLLYKSVDTIESLRRFQKFNKLTTIHNIRYTSSPSLSAWGIGRLKPVIAGAKFEVGATYKVSAWFKSSHASGVRSFYGRQNAG